MIYGIGLDVQLIPQLKGVVEGRDESYLQKIFTPDEITYCSKYRKPEQHFAGRWAVKEAYLKAIGTGISGGYRLSDIETIRLSSGQPHIILHGRVLEHFREHHLRAFVSITHSGDYAAAQVILEHQQEDELT